MAPDTPALLLKLFGNDRLGPGHSLQHIRDKIYSHAWSRIRRDDHKLDFVISERGINRNVPERSISSDYLYGAIRGPCMPPPPCHLHLVNKQVSKDFSRYIYSVNDLEVDVDLKPLHSNGGQIALDRLQNLLSNPNLKRHTRTVRVRIHFPAEYPASDLPSFNQASLNNIASALDAFQSLSYLAIRMVPGQGAPLDYELRVAAFPFYPMRMTNWTIRILNAQSFPYTWDLVDARKIVLLNQAYEAYQQTGSLTAPIVQNTTDTPRSGPKDQILDQSSSSVRQPTNGSKKRRSRKQRAAETAKQVISPCTLTSVQSPGPQSTTNDPPQTDVEVQLLDPDKSHTHPVAGSTAAEEQSLDPANTPHQVSSIEYPHPTSAPSPPLSSTQEKELACAVGSTDSTVPSPTNSSVDKIANDTLISEQAEDKLQQKHGPPSPAPSSVTLVPCDDDLPGEHVNNVIDAAGDFDGTIQLQQADKKRRSKKGRRNKTKSNAVQSAELHHDTGSGGTVEFEVQRATIQPEQPKPLEDPALRLEEAAVEPSSSTNRFDLTRGKWSAVGDSHALFTPNTGTASFYARTPRIERYLRQQERLLAARSEAKKRQKQAKARNQTRKARQLLLRRDNIATDSPLLRAMERPRDNSRTQVRPKSYSPCTILDKEQTKTLVGNYHQMEDQARKLRGQIRECERAIDKTRGRGSMGVQSLQDDEKRSLDHQVKFGSPSRDHRFDFDTGTIGTDSSIDSLDQESPESVTQEDAGDRRDEGDRTAKINCHLITYRLPLKLQEGASEPYKTDLLEPQRSESQQSAGNDPSATLEGSLERHSKPLSFSPTPPVFTPQGEHDDEVQIFNHRSADSRDLEGVAPNEGVFRGRLLDDEQNLGDAVDLPSGNPLRKIHLECGPGQQPVSQPCPADNYFGPPVLPVPLPLSSQEVPLQKSRDELASGCERSSTETLPFKVTRRASETSQPFLGSNERLIQEHGRSATETELFQARVDGIELEESQNGRRDGQRGRRGRGPSNDRGHHGRTRGNYRSNQRGGRTPTIMPRVENSENPWAIAVQASDREFAARNEERRIALERDMRAKGTKYIDFAAPIHDNYIQLDEDRKHAGEKVGSILYGARSEALSPSGETMLVQEAMSADSAETKVPDSHDADSV